MRLLCFSLALSFLTGVLATGDWKRQADGRYEAHSHKTLERDVCVIGGGSAGTYTAIRLQQMGKSVAVVERNDRLGGHVNTYQVPGTNATIDYGVVVFDDTPLTHDYFNHFDIPLVTPPTADSAPAQYADFSTGTPIPASALAAGAGNATAAFVAYAGLLAQYPYLVEGNGFNGIPEPVPKELLMTFGDFVQE